MMKKELVNDLEKRIHLFENNYHVERRNDTRRKHKSQTGGGHLAEEKGNFQRQPSRLHDGDQNGNTCLDFHLHFCCI